MNSIRRFGAALAVAGMLAGVGGSAVEARAKDRPGGTQAICDYLKSIIDYPMVSPSVLKYVLRLYYDTYHCDAL